MSLSGGLACTLRERYAPLNGEELSAKACVVGGSVERKRVVKSAAVARRILPPAANLKRADVLGEDAPLLGHLCDVDVSDVCEMEEAGLTGSLDEEAWPSQSVPLVVGVSSPRPIEQTFKPRHVWLLKSKGW